MQGDVIGEGKSRYMWSLAMLQKLVLLLWESMG